MRVLIVPNTQNPDALAAARRLATWLADADHEPVMLAGDSAHIGLPGIGEVRPAACDLTVALGGDGTILRAVHSLDGEETPVLGVNLGRLGFLTGADADEMTDAVQAALEGRARVDRLAMLDVEVHESAASHTHRALNEVFCGRGAGARAVELAIAVDGRPLTRFVCDGLIVATPAGSTAYAMSVGGPLVAPTVCGCVLVPVGAHTLAQRPIVLGPADVVEITCPNPQRADACVTVDGVHLQCPRFERVTVRIGDRSVPLVRPHGRDFYDVVRRKFLGG